MTQVIMTRELYEERVRSGFDGLVKQAILYPDVAKWIFEERNGVDGEGLQNRIFRESWAKELAEKWKAGLWERNGHAIIVGTNAFIVDGQHRVKVPVITGLPLTIDFRFGIPREAMDTCNQGRRSKPHDILRHHGYRNATILGGCLNWLGRWTHHSKLPTAINIEIAPEVRLQMVRGEFADAEAAVTAAGTLLKDFPQYRSSSVAAFAMVVCSRTDKAASAHFFHALRSGLNLEGDSPIYRLRAGMLAKATGIGIKGSLNKVDQLKRAALTVKAFRLYRKGQPCHLLRWSPEQEFPEA